MTSYILLWLHSQSRYCSAPVARNKLHKTKLLRKVSAVYKPIAGYIHYKKHKHICSCFVVCTFNNLVDPAFSASFSVRDYAAMLELITDYFCDNLENEFNENEEEPGKQEISWLLPVVYMAFITCPQWK